MTERMIDAVLEEYHDEILVSARARMRGDESMAALATQRDMGESAMVGQVIGFWLAAIRTDLALGSTAAIEQNLGWLVRLRSGQGLPFEDELVATMFDDIADEIGGRLESDSQRRVFRRYRTAVRDLIVAAFPQAGGGRT